MSVKRNGLFHLLWKNPASDTDLCLVGSLFLGIMFQQVGRKVLDRVGGPFFDQLGHACEAGVI